MCVSNTYKTRNKWKKKIQIKMQITIKLDRKGKILPNTRSTLKDVYKKKAYWHDCMQMLQKRGKEGRLL